jgi:hypothetical protein
MSNYRPIALLTSFSKVLETVLYRRLNEHINCSNVLSEEQYGFQRNSSTDKASFKLINDIIQAVNNKILVDCIFCNLQKAFDYIDHDILLSKLEFYGIVGSAKVVIASYLKDSYQRVLNNGTSSRWGKINNGVPQGSILGPLLFINDLPLMKDCEVDRSISCYV